MAAVVLGDITNLACFINKESVCAVEYAFDTLFTLYIVCYVYERKRNCWIFYILYIF